MQDGLRLAVEYEHKMEHALLRSRARAVRNPARVGVKVFRSLRDCVFPSFLDMRMSRTRLRPFYGSIAMDKMKLLAALLLAAFSVNAVAALSVFGREWIVPVDADWQVGQEEGVTVLHLVNPRNPLSGPRRPIQFALTEIPRYKRLTIEADVKPLDRSLMIVFAYQDAAHFNYVHLSVDTGKRFPAHNGVFHVYGGERVRISHPEGPPAFPQSQHWYRVTLTHDANTGTVAVTVDGKTVPALRAVDVSLGPGKIGLGSFDETADFKNVKITTQ